MNTGGGFLFEAADATLPPRDGRDDFDAQSSHGASADAGLLEVRKLSQKQEIRLMNYLDDALLEINRNFSKRYTASKSSLVPNVEAFLERYDALLAIVASIPPIGPSAALLVSYLLRITSEMTDGIQGYDLHREANGSDYAKARVEHSLSLVVTTLSLLDRFWAAVLRGQMLQYRAAKSNASREKNNKDFVHRFEDCEASASLSEDYTQSSLEAGRYSRSNNAKDPPDSRNVAASKGIATVPQTQRIRLRNIVVLARDCLFGWMRAQLDAPAPPKMDGPVRQSESGDNNKDVITVEGDIDQPEEQELGLEEVVKAEHSPNNVRMPQNASSHGEKEQVHYEDLFSRRLDPDESDEGEEEDDKDGTENLSHKRERSSSATQSVNADHHSKRRRSVTPLSADRSTLPPPPTDGGASMATLGGTGAPTSQAASVLRWDISFAHLFSRTLRTLSDIQERTDSVPAGSRQSYGAMATARLHEEGKEANTDAIEQEADE